MKVEAEFISGAANTVAKGVVWLEVEDGRAVVLYGISNLIAVADVETQSVLCTLPGHLDRLTTLTKLSDISKPGSSDNKTSVVSSGADGQVIVWEHEADAPLTCWNVVARLQLGSKGAIATHSCLSTSLGTLIAASNSHGTLVLWHRPKGVLNVEGNESGGFVMLETLQMLPNTMPYDLSLMDLPNDSEKYSPHTSYNSVLLVIGGVDSKVHLRLLPLMQNDSIMSFATATSLVGVLSGHDDWIRCLTEAAYMTNSKSNITSLFFASGSQDSKIRIWRVTPVTTTGAGSTSNVVTEDSFLENDENDDEETNQLQEGSIVADEEGLGEARCVFTGNTCSRSATELSSRNCDYLVTLDALLVGHEDWVSSVHWIVDDGTARTEVDPSKSIDSFYIAHDGPQMKLFSTSMDRNMVIWSPEVETGIWLPTTRMGDIGGNLGGSVGGNLLGFVGSCINFKRSSVLGVGFGGSFHLWHWGPEKKNEVVDEESNGSQGKYAWRPVPFLTGHFAPVRDLDWGYSTPPSGDPSLDSGPFLISVSSDQTCRLFSQLYPSSMRRRKWCELSRPQIHGYDLSCIQLAPYDSAPFTLYSGGDEKAIRIFQAPGLVAEGLVQLSGNLAAQEYLTRRAFGENFKTQLVHRAYIPELGLSNKSADMMSEDEVNEQASRGVDNSLWVSGPPLEGQLSDHTIWPETKKLFGHVGDVVCLHVSPCGKWIASAGKGRDAASACIRLWEIARIVCVAALADHDSTVTALRFSSNSRYLVSGGKDRSLFLYVANPLYDEIDNSAVPPFIPCACAKKAHKRIIWDISWISVDGDACVLASVSRDGVFKIWSALPAGSEGSNTRDLVQIFNSSPFAGNPITAVDVTRLSVTLTVGDARNQGWLIALGAENGNVEIWFASCSLLMEERNMDENDICSRIIAILPEFCHGATVRRLRWGSVIGGSNKLKLGSCGDDHTVRVFDVDY